MPPLNTLARHEESLVAVREKWETTLGLPTARVLLGRAIWQAAQRHPALALIAHDDAGLSFQTLEESYATRPQEEIATAFDDLSAEMLHIVARLLGRGMAQHLAASLATRPCSKPGRQSENDALRPSGTATVSASRPATAGQALEALKHSHDQARVALQRSHVLIAAARTQLAAARARTRRGATGAAPARHEHAVAPRAAVQLSPPL